MDIKEIQQRWKYPPLCFPVLAIERDWIHLKCPFDHKQGIHRIENDGNLRDRLITDVEIDCPTCNGYALLINMHTERIRMVSNKNKTCYLRLRSSKERQQRIWHKQIQEDALEFDKDRQVMVRF